MTLRNKAQEIDDQHRGKRSTRALTQDHTYIGLVGEGAVVEEFAYAGASLNTEIMGNGDAGVDVEAAGIRVQVKTTTSHKPDAYLLVENKPKALGADVFVLAVYSRGADLATSVGWLERNEFLGLARRGDPCKKGMDNFYCTRLELRPMCDLHRCVKSALRRPK